MLLHLAGYAFFEISDPAKIRYTIRDRCVEWGFRGTILLSQEGVNVHLTGEEAKLRQFEVYLIEEHGFSSLKKNETWVKDHAYKRMLVRLKPEIVTMGVQNVDARTQTGKHLAPGELKKWLDEKRDFYFVDTRNDYEVTIGKFKGAKELRVPSFREFAKEATMLSKELKESKPLVMYCTGGIRCEKSSAHFIHKLGFKNVFQLEGGILNYFKQCGGDHWDGECFVFDKRVAVDANLSETKTELCLNCDWPVTEQDQIQGPYSEGEHCPRCFTSDS